MARKDKRYSRMVVEKADLREILLVADIPLAALHDPDHAKHTVALIAHRWLEDTTTYRKTARLLSFGNSKIYVIKAIRAATGVGLLQAKSTVERAPVTLTFQSANMCRQFLMDMEELSEKDPSVRFQ